MDKKDTVSVSKNLCKSVFKSGKSTPSVSDFTQKWIELINNREKKENFFALKMKADFVPAHTSRS